MLRFGIYCQLQVLRCNVILLFNSDAEIYVSFLLVCDHGTCKA